MPNTPAKQKAPPLRPLSFRTGTLDWTRPYVMGVLNITPDSFSDGGRRDATSAASVSQVVAEAQEMARNGADILDVGGESTRPGASPVSAEAERARVIPIIEALCAAIDLPISIDTSKASVARLAVEAGAEIVNDISGGKFDAEMVPTVDALGVAFICGHVRGSNLAEVHQGPSVGYAEVLSDLRATFEALPVSLRSRSVADPCIGFGKDLQTNLALLRRAGNMSESLGSPILVGPSRKRFLGEITGRPVGDRDAATVGACLASVSGGAHMLRVHDVSMTVSALQVFCAAQELAA